MSQQATMRLTLGSVLGTVDSAAVAVSSTFDTLTKSISMANKYVSDAASKQRIRSVVEMHDFTEKLSEEKAMEETLRKKNILDFCNASPDNKELFEASYGRIKALLNTDSDKSE